MIPALKACLEIDMVSDYGIWSWRDTWLAWSGHTVSVASRVVTVERCHSIRANGRSIVG